MRIGLPDDYAIFLGPVLERLSKSHPGVSVEVICQPSEVIHELMGRGEVDLTLTTARCGIPPVEGTVIRLG